MPIIRVPVSSHDPAEYVCIHIYIHTVLAFLVLKGVSFDRGKGGLSDCSNSEFPDVFMHHPVRPLRYIKTGKG